MAPDNVVTLPTVQVLLRSEFGLDIPQNAIKTILGRLQRHGFVKLDRKAYIRHAEALAKLNISAVRKKVVGMYDVFISALVSFAGNELKVNLKDSEAERALGEFLKTYRTNGAVTTSMTQNETTGHVHMS